jgi:hypothetical protein
MNELSALYEKDYYAWARQNAELLKAGRLTEADIGHLIEELEGMGASNLRELINRLRILLMHLLKWQYQLKHLDGLFGKFNGGSWRATIIEQRGQLHDLLEDNPSLKPLLAESIPKAYKKALNMAIEETRMLPRTFPKVCPYTEQQILDNDFYPAQE